MVLVYDTIGLAYRFTNIPVSCKIFNSFASVIKKKKIQPFLLQLSYAVYAQVPSSPIACTQSYDQLGNLSHFITETRYWRLVAYLYAGTQSRSSYLQRSYDRIL